MGDHAEHIHGDMSMHPMAFHFGSIETILFKFWNVSSPIGLIATWFIVFGGCVLLEGIRWFRVHRQNVRSADEIAAQNSGSRT
jgi:hypothetical protein